VESKREYNFLTKIVREEINELKNRDWGCFIKKQDANPLNTKPFWQKINTLRGKAKSNSIPTLLKDNNKYETDDEKANLFADILRDGVMTIIALLNHWFFFFNKINYLIIKIVFVAKLATVHCF
jgi:hypothetical protein